MIPATLPPLRRSAVEPPFGRRLANLALVVVLHAGLLYLALYVSVRNELIDLPPSISVRLLPMLEERPPAPEPAVPPPPRPKPVEQRPPVQRPEPVMAVKSEAPAASFAVAPQPAPVAQPVVPTPAPAPPAPLVAARFDADYLHNPKPVYPPLSRRRGEEGKVLLKVRVSAQGEALGVAIQKSSGFDSLDTAASEAVTRWRFVPARRGDEAVESSVIVPITFALE